MLEDDDERTHLLVSTGTGIAPFHAMIRSNPELNYSLLHGIRSKVNLIPLNEAPGLPYKRPSEQRIENFVRKLTDRGLTVSVRKSRGHDIRAACGQLIVEGARPAPGQRAATLIDRP